MPRNKQIHRARKGNKGLKRIRTNFKEYDLLSDIESKKALPDKQEDMTPVKVYRWEKLLAKYGDKKRMGYVGPLSSHFHDKSHEPINNYVRRTMHYITDAYDDCKGFHSGMLCAVTDKDQLDSWVNFKAAAMCEAEGFVIGVYEVPKCKLLEGKEQCAFHPGNATRTGELSYAEFWEDDHFYSKEKLIEKIERLKSKYRENGPFRSLR